MQQCPNNHFVEPTRMVCTSDCNRFTLYNHLTLISSSLKMGVCVSVCPAGFMKDTVNKYCVTQCLSSYYLNLANVATDPTCVNNCSSLGWAYEIDRTCKADCPSGYYKQIYAVIPLQRCVSLCIAAFGENSTGFCVTTCPFPSYAE